MTPKTQSDKLCELSQRYRQIKEYNNSGDEFGNGYACGKEDAYTTVADELEDLLSEPVAEPASTGEPPPTERFFRGDGVEEKVTYQPVTFAAARPSEPSTESECSFLSSAGAKPCDCGEVYSEPAAPQTSAEPACQKCVEGIHGHCSGDCECRLSKCNLKVSAPQPVSAPNVEEVAKIISAKVFGWHNLENLASKEQKEACTQAAMEIIESLRRYFPPASQTPQTVHDAAVEIVGELLNSDPVLYCGAEVRKTEEIIKKLLATPASTARTDEPRYTAKEIISLIRSAEWEDEFMHADDESYVAFITGKLAQPAAPGSVPQAPPKCSEPRVVELNPPNAPDKYAVFIGKVFIWEFDFEKEAEELRDNLKRVGVPQAEPPK